jgi:hypothetical protein
MRRRTAAAIPLLAVLAGCASSMSEQFGHSVWITPGKYNYHNCLQAQGVDQGFAKRQQELEELMTRAAQGGGEAIGTMVYRTEYQQVLGERKALADVFAQKRCALDSKRSSDRSMF